MAGRRAGGQAGRRAWRAWRAGRRARRAWRAGSAGLAGGCPVLSVRRCAAVQGCARAAGPTRDLPSGSTLIAARLPSCRTPRPHDGRASRIPGNVPTVESAFHNPESPTAINRNISPISPPPVAILDGWGAERTPTFQRLPAPPLGDDCDPYAASRALPACGAGIAGRALRGGCCGAGVARRALWGGRCGVARLDLAISGGRWVCSGCGTLAGSNAARLVGRRRRIVIIELVPGS